VPKTLEYPRIPLDGILRRSAERYPERPALVFYGRRTTYRQLDAGADAFAAGLRALGVKKGDRVVLHLPNVPHFPIAFFGILRAGAVVVQANPLLTARELGDMVEATGAETLVSLDIFWPTVEAVYQRGILGRAIIGDVKDALPFPLSALYPLKKRREGRAWRIPRLPWVHPFKGVAGQPPEPGLDAGVDPQEDVAVLQSTGGTTGTPKQATLTHHNLVANTLQTAAWFSNAKAGGEVFLSVLPFFHVYGLTVDLLTPIQLGATLVLHPDPREVGHILKLMGKHRPTVFPGVPTLYVAINHHPRVGRYDLKSIRACISGAAPLPQGVRREFERLTGGRLVEGYGLSEASPVTHCNPLFGLVKDGTIGIPLPDTDAMVVDLKTGEELPQGEVGELCVRGPQVMKGYWNNPVETALALTDGWLHTGDIARMDEDGYFTIVDRKKDIIICGGYNVYPREVEEILFQHPAIKEAAAVGVPDEYRGETVKAIVVLKEGMRASPDEIIAFCKEHLAPYKVPRTVEFAQDLPKTMVGKVLRRALREEGPKGGEGL
jgi:long-chain acyl-CoA synthetase